MKIDIVEQDKYFSRLRELLIKSRQLKYDIDKLKEKELELKKVNKEIKELKQGVNPYKNWFPC